jgi:hypothetical protein
MTDKTRGRDSKKSNANSDHLPTTIMLNWKPRFKSLCSICCVMESKPTYDSARISSAEVDMTEDDEGNIGGELKFASEPNKVNQANVAEVFSLKSRRLIIFLPVLLLWKSLESLQLLLSLLHFYDIANEGIEFFVNVYRTLPNLAREISFIIIMYSIKRSSREKGYQKSHCKNQAGSDHGSDKWRRLLSGKNGSVLAARRGRVV